MSNAPGSGFIREEGELGYASLESKTEIPVKVKAPIILGSKSSA
jgi:hypothetical protein